MAKNSASTCYTFHWKGTNAKGATVEGEITGSNSAFIKMELRRLGIVPNKIVKQTSLFSIFKRKEKITAKDVTVFILQLSTMISAGIPLVQSMDIVAKGLHNKMMQRMILQLKNDLEAGNTFADSLKKHLKCFDDLFCNLVHAGEQSGTLDIMLTRLAIYKEKLETLKGKIKKALFYPAAVVTVALFVSLILLIFVIPQFQTIFQNVGTNLPFLTLQVIALSNFMQNYWWVILAASGGGIISLRSLYRTNSTFIFNVDRNILKLPLVGPILEKAVIARFARTLATTIAAGMPLIEALGSVAGITGNRLYSRATRLMQDEVAKGQSLQIALAQTNLFPSMVVQMVAIGEEAGALEKMLGKVADYYDEQVDNAVANLGTLLEPTIMVILGVIVGTLIIAMYLPILKLGQAI